MQVPTALALALVGALIYSVSSAGETLAVKSLNYNTPPIILPAYTAFMSNQMWILMIPLWVCQKGGAATRINLREYLAMGILTFVITIFRSVSVNAMPGSVFTLLLSTSIVFTIGISLILGRRFNQWHILAAGLCICSAASIGISAFLTAQESGANYTLGVPTALGAAFFVALMTVWQEKLQASWEDVNRRLIEMALVSSFIASVIIIIYAVFTNEVKLWSPTLNGGGSLIIGVSVALPGLKLLVRNSKYSVIQYSSAFFFEFVQASSALLGSVANILIFGEPWNSGYIVAFVCMAASFATYSYAKRVNKLTKAVVEKNPDPIIIVVAPWK